MRIGIAGTGKMGAAIAARLHECGEEVTVWNRSREKAETTGRPVAGSPLELALGSNIVISSLFDEAALEKVYRGAHDMALLALDLFSCIVTRWVDRAPPFSAPLTLWLSMIAAVGLASRPARFRHLT